MTQAPLAAEGGATRLPLGKWRDLPRSERLFGWALVLFMCQDAVVKSVEFALSLLNLPGTAPLATAIIYLPFAMALLSSLSERRPLRIAAFAPVYLGLVVLFTFSYIAHPEYEQVLFDHEWSYNALDSVFSPLSSIWIFLIIIALRRPEAIYLALRNFAYVNFLYGLVRYVQAEQRGHWIAYVQTGAEIQSGYSLGFGYDMLTGALVFLLLAFRGYFIWRHLLLAGFSLALILLAGSRASLAIGLVGAGIFGLYHSRSYLKRYRLAPVLMVIGCTVLAVVVVQINKLILALSDTMALFGFSSRSVEALVSGQFDDDNGRDSIYAIAQQLVESGGALGHGYYGDRYHISSSFWWGYPHSIVYEFQITFGPLIGILLLSLIALGIVYAFLRSADSRYRELMLLFLVLALQLAVSNSYLYSIGFWGLLALATLAVKRQQGSANLRHSSLTDNPYN